MLVTRRLSVTQDGKTSCNMPHTNLTRRRPRRVPSHILRHSRVPTQVTHETTSSYNLLPSSMNPKQCSLNYSIRTARYSPCFQPSSIPNSTMEVKSLRIAEWNANGLANHKLELIQFLHDKNIDVLLASETHFTDRTVLKNTLIFAVPQ
jgi:hypothetical protein